MGDQLSNRRFRRIPAPPDRPAPGRLPSGRRLVVVVVGLFVLAVLAALAIAFSQEQARDDDAATTTTATTAGSPSTPVTGGRAPDDVVARQLLPATLGRSWVEVSREDTPVPAEVDAEDPCAARAQPIATGLVVRASFDRLTTAIMEQASLVAGVVTEGTVVPRLDDAAVIECLHEGLAPQVRDGNELVVGDPDLPPAPEGAELTVARFDEHNPDGQVVRRFELVLLRRDRAVTFLIVVVNDPSQGTPVADLVAALDAPLAAGARRLN